MVAWFLLQWIVIGYLVFNNIQLRAKNEFLTNYIRKR